MEGQVREAATLATTAINSDRKDAMAYAVRGRALLLDNKVAAATTDCETAVRLNPGSGIGYVFEAMCYQSEQKTEQSKKAFEKGLSLLNAAKTPIEYYARGAAYENAKKPDAALADYSSAITINPRFVLCYVKRGRLYDDNHQSDAAIGEYNKAIQLNPSFATPYFMRGNIYYEKQQYDAALADFSKVLTLTPDDIDALFNRGVMYKKKGQYELALADYNKVVSLRPKDGDIYGNRGNIYWLTNKMAEAYNDYSKAIELNPGKANYYVARGDVYTRWEQYDAALKDYNKAVSLDNTNVNAYMERGNVYLNGKQPQYDLALADYQQVLRLDPNNSNGHMNIGVIHHNKQQYAEAIDEYTKAITADPNNMLAYLNRAGAYDAIGKRKPATADRKKYTDLGGVLPPTGSDDHRSIYPEGTFDPKLAQAALTRGLSSIAGRACTKKDGLIFYASGVKVRLFPVTPYLEEWYELREKKEGKKTSVYMSDEANRYSIEAITGQDGRFVFEGLKPGKYFIQLIHNFNQRKTAQIFTGSNVWQNGPVQEITNYYYDQDYIVERSQRLERFVEIKDDGDTKKVSLTNAGGIFKTCEF